MDARCTLQNLFNHEWEQTESPAGAIQWMPKDGALAATPCRTPTSQGKRATPMMLTTDLSLKEDPAYREISKRFMKNPEEFDEAFARAWFKLTHRDMGPRSRYLGAGRARRGRSLLQDPLPEVDHELIDDDDIASSSRRTILDSGLTVAELVRTAWASASSYRDTDKRGGANGARVRLAPQKNWAVNNPDELARVLANTRGYSAGLQ
ncbi:MAG: hypothetical protein U5K76_12235 [Woeseiaceae bacterium]|nr:hypothetical protein [Woeseiaceae bacterium]